MQCRSHVSPVKYKMCCYIPEDGILHSHRRENHKSYTIISLGVPQFYLLDIVINIV
jgi:hypothetical protein